MECKTTSTRSRQSGVFLAEWIISMGVGSLVLVALAAFSLFSAKFFVTLRNCVDLDSQARLAVDRMSKEIRQAVRVSEFNSAAPTQITLIVGNTNVTFAFNNSLKRLERQSRGKTTVLLTGCDSASFGIFTRQATNATYETFPTATTANAKVVQINWNCSRSIMGRKENTVAMQTAQVVIRKQGK